MSRTTATGCLPACGGGCSRRIPETGHAAGIALRLVHDVVAAHGGGMVIKTGADPAIAAPASLCRSRCLREGALSMRATLRASSSVSASSSCSPRRAPRWPRARHRSIRPLENCQEYRRLRRGRLFVQLQQPLERHHQLSRLRQPPQHLHPLQRRARRAVGEGRRLGPGDAPGRPHAEHLLPRRAELAGRRRRGHRPTRRTGSTSSKPTSLTSRRWAKASFSSASSPRPSASRTWP